MFWTTCPPPEMAHLIGKCSPDKRTLVGIVTIDDLLEVAEAEATEDIHKIGGVSALEEPYMQMGFWQMIKRRAGWLVILFLGELLTATAMSFFEKEIARAAVLVLFSR